MAVIFYLLYTAGILFFVIAPGLEGNSLKATLLRAALFGLITYAACDLTNPATQKVLPALLSIVDMVRGTVLSVLVSDISFMAGKRHS